MEHDSKDILDKERFLVYRDKRLGSGVYGTVYKGYDKKTGRKIAIKHVPQADLETARKEVEVLLRLTQHDNIVRIIGSFEHSDTLWIAMQLCKGATLDKFMEEKDPDMPVKLDIIEQFVDGLLYMHTEEATHRDLKPWNIMIIAGHQLKICDFGQAKFVDPSKINAGTLAGSLNYIAPEMLKTTLGYDHYYDPFMVDIFSSGLIILGVVTFIKGEKFVHFFQPGFGGQQMFSDKHDRKLQEKLSSFHHPCQQSMALISLVSRMVSYTPQHRPHIRHVLESVLHIQQNDAATLQSEDTSCASGSKDAATQQSEATSRASGRQDADNKPSTSGSSGGARPKTSGADEERTVKVAAGSQGGGRHKTSGTKAETDIKGGRAVAGGAGGGADVESRPSTPRASGSAGGARHETSRAGAKRTITERDVATGKVARTTGHGRVSVAPAAQGGARPMTSGRQPKGGRVEAGGAGEAERADVESRPSIPRVPLGVIPSLVIISEHDLGFEAHWRAGISCSKHILLCDKSPHPHLHLYKHDGREYSRVWKKPLPKGMDSDCYKALIGSAHILLQNAYDEVTVQYNKKLKECNQFERRGFLLDVTDEEQTVYGRGTWREEDGEIVEFNDDWQLHVYGQEEQPPVTLQPPGGRGWKDGLSICSLGEKFVIVEAESRSFDVFTKQGEHVLHRELSFTPDVPYAITTYADYVFVREACLPTKIHVLTMQGEQVRILPHTELGLGERDVVLGIRCCGDEMVVCVGNWPEDSKDDAITSLRAYRVVQ